MVSVSISKGNSKMGEISSVSLPAIMTCRKNAPCFKECYAHKLEKLRPNVRNAYLRNYEVYKNNPEQYWSAVESEVSMARFFRFHVSGDIPDRGYLVRMINLATKYPHCEILCFSKQFEIVNDVLNVIAAPKNLHLILSGWNGLDMQNPHGLPEAHVRYKDGSTTARSGAVECGGNCTSCARTNEGCWTLQRGQQVVFNKH